MSAPESIVLMSSDGVEKVVGMYPLIQTRQSFHNVDMPQMLWADG